MLRAILATLHRAFHEPETPLYRWANVFVWVLILASVAILGVDLGLEERSPEALRIADLSVLSIFAVELLLRVISFRPAAADLFDLGPFARIRVHLMGRLRFLFRPLIFIDLLTVIALIPALRGIRVFRLLRLVRTATLFRHANPMFGILQALRQNGLLFVFALSVLGLATLLGGSSFYLAEHGTNSGVRGVGDGLWWAIVTITTVGFGDLAPVTTAGRIIGATVMVCGLFVLATFAGIIGHTLVGAVLTIREEQYQMSNYANHVVVCGYDGGGGNVLTALARELDLATTELLVFAPFERPKEIPVEVIWVEGNPTSERELDKTCLHQARAAVIVASRDVPPAQADAATILTVFTIRSYLRKLDVDRARVTPLHLVAEILDTENVDHALTAGADEVVETTRVGSSMLAHAAAVPGAASLLDDLASPGGQNLFLGSLPKDWVEPGTTYGLVAKRLRKEKGGLALGLRAGGGGPVIINPPADRPIADDDGLFYIASEPLLAPRPH